MVEGGQPVFTACLARCKKWLSRGGKSAVYFAKTRDERYVVKQLTRSEKQSFLDFAPAYFRSGLLTLCETYTPAMGLMTKAMLLCTTSHRREAFVQLCQSQWLELPPVLWLGCAPCLNGRLAPRLDFACIVCLQKRDLPISMQVISSGIGAQRTRKFMATGISI